VFDIDETTQHDFGRACCVPRRSSGTADGVFETPPFDAGTRAIANASSMQERTAP